MADKIVLYKEFFISNILGMKLSAEYIEYFKSLEMLCPSIF